MLKLEICLWALVLTLALTQADQQYASQKRTACLVLSRYNTNAHYEDLLQPIIKSLDPENQQTYIHKIYATSVEACESKIT